MATATESFDARYARTAIAYIRQQPEGVFAWRPFSVISEAWTHAHETLNSEFHMELDDPQATLDVICSEFDVDPAAWFAWYNGN